MAADRDNRIAGQAVYQRAYRMQQKALRRPSRDDIARVVLHLIITRALQRGKDRELQRWINIIVKKLTTQGFDRNATRVRIAQLVDQYESGWDFQRKLHLTPAADEPR